jgi:hypothetical protein
LEWWSNGKLEQWGIRTGVVEYWSIGVVEEWIKHQQRYWGYILRNRK